MTEPNPTDVQVTQADIDLCVELNIPDYNAPIIARHRIAALQQSRSAVEALREIEAITARKQLPITAQINQICIDALTAALSQESADGCKQCDDLVQQVNGLKDAMAQAEGIIADLRADAG